MNNQFNYSENNHQLSFDQFDRLIDLIDINQLEILNIEEMFNHDPTKSAFVAPIKKANTPLFSIPTTGPFIFNNNNWDFQMQNKYQQKINTEEPFVQNFLPLQSQVLEQRDPSNSIDSEDISFPADEEKWSDNTFDSIENISTNQSMVPSPILADTLLQQTPNENQNSKKDTNKLTQAFIKTFRLEYDNLNDCVNQLLKKSKEECQSGRDIKRRQRKNKEQLKILENEYAKDPNWSRDYIKKVSQKLGLRECQVYKWHWDQRKKDGAEGYENSSY